jgi:hypothetical protein
MKHLVQFFLIILLNLKNDNLIDIYNLDFKLKRVI